MVRPSHPRLISRVLDAVTNLGDTRGSSAREILSFIRRSNVSPKNLTLQVHRALKNALNAGLLRHRSGRYKALVTLNAISNPSVNKETATNNQKNEKKSSKSDVRTPIADVESSRQTQERKKRTTSRRRNSRQRSSKARRKTRRSPYRRSTVAQNRKRRQRKRTYEDEEVEDQSSGRYALHGRDDSPVSFNRRTKRSRVSKRELESDFSDESDCDSDTSRKRVSRAKKSRRKEARAKSKDKSGSRARSPQQTRQHSTEEIENDRQHSDEDHESTKRDVTHQEAHEDDEKVCEPNDSNSGSTLENSRD